MTKKDAFGVRGSSPKSAYFIQNEPDWYSNNPTWQVCNINSEDDEATCQL